MKFTHLLRPKSCMKHLRINGDAEIVCSKCGREFGFTYQFNPIRAFVYYRYNKYKPEIARFVRHAAKPPSVEDWAEIYSGILEKASDKLFEAIEANTIVEDKPAADQSEEVESIE